MSDAPLTLPGKVEASSTRLVLTLALAGVLAGGLLAAAYHSTLPAIRATRAERERQAVSEVLRAPAAIETLYAVGGRLSETPPAGADPSEAERAFRGRDASGRVVGYAVFAAAAGYADQVRLLVGYEADTRRLIAFTVLDMRETPGLGDKIREAAFAGQFAGREAPLVGVKDGKATGKPGEVVTITGATISSRAVIRAINDAIARWTPLLAAAPAGGGDGR